MANINFSASFGVSTFTQPMNFGRTAFPLGGSIFQRPGFDGFMPSAGVFDGCGSLGGLGFGMANPAMGLNSFQGANQQQLQGALFMLGQMMGQLASQGQRGPGLGGYPGCFAGPGMPGQMGPMGPGQMGPMGPMGPGQMGAPRTVQLQQGQDFTTPGGVKISWKGDEVKIHEPGSGAQGVGGAGRAFGANQGSQNMAAAWSGPGYSAALAISTNGAAPGALGCGCHHAAKDGKPRDWRVWGDPHIDHPNGSKSDFDKKNAMFPLSDGSQIIMGADSPNGTVKSVQVVLPGGQPNWQGLDPSQTSVMQDDGSGHFKSVGTADRFMNGGFNNMGGNFGMPHGHGHGVWV